MAEKSEAVDGSSIFESLFGGFSNGLSIFTNNPFRRKDETVSAAVEGDGHFALKRLANESVSGEVEAEGTGKKLKKGNEDDGKEHSVHDSQNTMQSEEKSESSLKKVKRSEVEPGSEKKRRRTESSVIITSDSNLKNGSNENRKRKQESAADTTVEEQGGLDETVVESKKKTKTSSETLDSAERILRRKRGTKKRQLEVSAEEREGELHHEVKQKDTKIIGNKLEQEGPRKNKKKQRAEDVDITGLECHLSNMGTEDTPADNRLGMETRSGSKRKKDTDVEELYERKRRETTDEKENAQTNENEGEGGVADMGIAHRSQGKRKLDDDENVPGVKKKKKATKDEKSNVEERLSRTIFVGNLPLKVKTKQLVREFSQFGVVESARLRSVPLVDSKLPRRAAVITRQLNESRSSLNAYVVFEREESAKSALTHNMKEYNGKHLRVDMATAPCKADKGGIEYDRARSIFVGNLPFDVEDEEVYALFKDMSPDVQVEAVRVVRDPQTSAGKGFAFVCFKNKVGAKTVLDNAESMKLRNRPLRIIRFGFKKKPATHKLPAKATSRNDRPLSKFGAEQRLSKKHTLSYEGTRAIKGDGRPGKVTGSVLRTAQAGKPGERDGGLSKLKMKGKKNPVSKRPAVAARKLASQGKAGSTGSGGRNRTQQEKGNNFRGHKRDSFKK